jgi:hypothetical protein
MFTLSMPCQQLKNLLPVATQISVIEPYLHMASQKQSLSLQVFEYNGRP